MQTIFMTLVHSLICHVITCFICSSPGHKIFQQIRLFPATSFRSSMPLLHRNCNHSSLSQVRTRDLLSYWTPLQFILEEISRHINFRSLFYCELLLETYALSQLSVQRTLVLAANSCCLTSLPRSQL